MPVYIEIKDGSDNTPALILEPEAAKSIINEMVAEGEHEDSSSYVFRAIELTEDEFKAIPKFTGF